MSELAANTNLHPHTHVKAMAPKVNFYEDRTFTTDPKDTLDEWLKRIFWQDYTIRYKHFTDGDTDSYIIRGHPIITDDGIPYLLTIHVFTCYCEPLNDNEQPPF